MEEEMNVIKTNDWSMNLEDTYYEENPDELLLTALEAVQCTAPGCYVNLVTPGSLGNPEQGLISSLIQLLGKKNVPVEDVFYVAQCGCGGYVTRVYR